MHQSSANLFSQLLSIRLKDPHCVWQIMLCNLPGRRQIQLQKRVDLSYEQNDQLNFGMCSSSYHHDHLCHHDHDWPFCHCPSLAGPYHEPHHVPHGFHMLRSQLQHNRHRTHHHIHCHHSHHMHHSLRQYGLFIHTHATTHTCIPISFYENFSVLDIHIYISNKLS